MMRFEGPGRYARDVDLDGPAIQTIIGADPYVRGAAVIGLDRFKAKVAVPYLRQALAITRDEVQKKAIEHVLRDLEPSAQ